MSFVVRLTCDTNKWWWEGVVVGGGRGGGALPLIDIIALNPASQINGSLVEALHLNFTAVFHKILRKVLNKLLERLLFSF